jgi:hypothetical protein
MALRYEPRAAAEHDHPPTLEGWQARMAAIARAERAFVAKHPDVPPYFHDRLARAAAGSTARGRGARLARWVRPTTPWLGPKVWASAEAYYGQKLWCAFKEGLP